MCVGTHGPKEEIAIHLQITHNYGLMLAFRAGQALSITAWLKISHPDQRWRATALDHEGARMRIAPDLRALGAGSVYRPRTHALDHHRRNRLLSSTSTWALPLTQVPRLISESR